MRWTSQGRSGRRVPVAVLALCLVVQLHWPRLSLAEPMSRMFEPTDLELQEPGVLQLDMQFGPVRGQGSYRLDAPDFEINLGLTNNIELDVDGDPAIGGPDSGDFRFNQLSPDNLWTSVKVGLLDYADTSADTAWTVGLQVGPKLPLARGAEGVGVEGLVLLGLRIHHTQLVLNLGGLLDPAPDSISQRPSGPELGLDINYGLDADGHWALTGEISAITYTSPDPYQFTTTAGITWSPTDDLDLSIVVLRGWLDGGDRSGVLLGISPKFHLW